MSYKQATIADHVIIRRGIDSDRMEYHYLVMQTRFCENILSGLFSERLFA